MPKDLLNMQNKANLYKLLSCFNIFQGAYA